jgi:nicotinic acid mononucleotide adenylyltransferase
VQSSTEQLETLNLKPETKIYITDAVQIDVSASEIRQKIKNGESGWRELVPEEVAKYVKKYNLYI